jgi:Uncharacterized protein family, UPF0114
MDDSPVTSEPHMLAERVVERTTFASRWLLAPFYLGLAVSLVVLLIKFVQKTITLVAELVRAQASSAANAVIEGTESARFPMALPGRKIGSAAWARILRPRLSATLWQRC